MAEEGVLAGLSVAALTQGPDLSIAQDIDRAMLVTVTERRTRSELDHYVNVMRKVVA
jgi:glycine cleavage system protein P-like pyridoxal-binding family